MNVSLIYLLARMMNAAHRVAYAALRWMGLLFGLIPKQGRLPTFVYRLVPYLFVIVVTLILGWYSSTLIPESRVPIPNWFVQRYYVAIQFVLFYLFVRLLIAGIQIFLAPDVSDFEDIDRAWNAGVEALAREGYDLQWLPIFLVNGALPEQRKSLFESARLQWKVNDNSDDPRFSALSFHACDEGLFICLNDVGATSRQLVQPVSRGAAASVVSSAGSAQLGQPTLRPGQVQVAGQQTMRPGHAQAVSQTQRPEMLQSAMSKTLPPGAVAPASHQSRYGETIRPGEISDVLKPQPVVRHGILEKLNQDELRLCRRRLAYVCQRLITERGSYCPLNGVLQIIPVRWSQSAAFEPLFNAIGDDIKTLHDRLHLQFPVVCLHSGLEEVTGLSHFVQRGKELDPRFPDSRAGSRYPAGLPVDEKSAGWVVERCMQWFRDWVYAEFAKSLSNVQNRQLYQFLCALSTRRDRLVRELRAIIGDLVSIRLTGCYFAATGSDATQKAFVHGVIQRLMSEQNDVAWDPKWRARDHRLLWLTFFVTLVTIGVLGIDGYLIWSIWGRATIVAAG